MTGYAVLAVAAVLTAVAFGATLTQSASGAQPWDPELSDNLILAKMTPFVLALGIAAGLVRRARPIAFAAFGLGLLLGIPTGMYQYLGGLLDHHPPFPLYLIYRVHYIGSALMLFAVAAITVSVWRDTDRSFLVPRGQVRRYLRGVAGELPAFLVRPFVGPLGIDMKSAPPPRGRYTFYETVVSYPWWAIGIGLITVTGIVKALRYVYPVPGPILFWASTLHVAAMVIITLKVLDQMRISLALDRRVTVGALAALWAASSLAIAYWMLTSAFTAQTAIKEGVLAQLALVFGGLGTAVLAALVLREFLRIVTRRTAS